MLTLELMNFTLQTLKKCYMITLVVSQFVLALEAVKGRDNCEKSGILQFPGMEMEFILSSLQGPRMAPCSRKSLPLAFIPEVQCTTVPIPCAHRNGQIGVHADPIHARGQLCPHSRYENNFILFLEFEAVWK